MATGTRAPISPELKLLELQLCQKEEGAGESAVSTVGELDENNNQPTSALPEEACALMSDEEDEEGYNGPVLESDTCYCLTESGERAMAWEATLQTMFPSCPSFWNRLLSDGRSH